MPGMRTKDDNSGDISERKIKALKLKIRRLEKENKELKKWAERWTIAIAGDKIEIGRATQFK